MRCPNCGQENPAGARFCFSCGRPFEDTPAREERKVVTVLFADLVGFTSRAEQLDPEDVRGLLAPYHQRLRGELERYGGTVEKFIGDAVVGAVTDVAAAQLYAARKLVEGGRRAEADAYLQPSLSFYRSLRATHRVRQGEALLAATA
jgi:class 3 adenylate cyclase